LDQEKIVKKVPWGKQEDELLKKIMAEGEESIPWTEVAKRFNENIPVMKNINERTGKQCRERWRNHLNPEITKASWTDNEDMHLLIGFKNYGNKWKDIAKMLKGRSENAVKNRFNILYKKFRGIPENLQVQDVEHALQAVTEEKKDDKEWVDKAIAEKKVAATKNGQAPSPKEEEKKAIGSCPDNNTTIRIKIPAELTQQLLPELPVSPKLQPTPGQSDRVIFTNLATKQELMLTEQGVFVIGPDKRITPYLNFSQIIKVSDNSIVTSSVFSFCIFLSNFIIAS